MRDEFFIARRLYFTDNAGEKQMSRPAIRMALTALIIGIVVMIITVFVVIGFKGEVTEKAVGITGHIEIVNFDNNNTYEMQPIAVSDSMLTALRNIDGVRSAELFITKPGMIKTPDAFQTIIFKGITLLEPSTQWNFFHDALISGRLPEQDNEIIISKTLSDKLNLIVDTSVLCYFIQDDIRARRFTISGIYKTGFSEMDDMFVAGSLKQIQKLNDWEENQVSGIAININNLRELEKMTDKIYFFAANKTDEDDNYYYTQNVEQLNPAIFSWLDLLDMNVVVIIILMLIVSGFSIISGLLILILDNIRLVGTLKALGANNAFLSRVFLIEAMMLVGKGVLWGNIIGLALCAIQYFTHLIPLDASAYYVNYVPISFHWGWWAVVNVGTIVVSLLVMLAPSTIVSRMSPADIMRFE